MDVQSFLKELTVDWSDFKNTSKQAEKIVKDIGGNPDLLRQLVDHVVTDPDLLSKSEVQEQLTFLVLHDAPERGFRLRLHCLPAGGGNFVHNHRYSFTSYLLKGHYGHTLYNLAPPLSDGSSNGWSCIQRPGTHEGVALPALPLSEAIPIWYQDQQSRSCYSLHNTAFHSNQNPQETTFTLFLRGPAELDCALVMNPPKKEYFWKYGRAHESSVEVESLSMQPEQFHRLRDELHHERLI